MSTLHAAAVLAASAEEHGDPAISPYLVGLITFLILMAMLGALVAFGGGREHT